MALAAVTGQVGCITVIGIFAALFLGLWADNTFGTSPWLTLASLVVSMPITLIIMFRVVKATTSRMVTDKVADQPKNSETPQQEEDIV